ncbi:MAG: nuclear transport factor 2 family protein [Chitinophagaceae bacterium]|nr:nuclear transport factor 2 family protein [Chitinophagaceae bacterium]
MNEHERLIADFYTSFQKLDGEGMAKCYHEDVFFYDPVFQDLQGDRAKSMWKMLCGNAKELTVEFGEITSPDEYGSCKWKAVYRFSRTGRMVTNKVTARFKFQDGKIIEHMDDFDIWRWSAQAMGIKGLLLGWTSAMKNKIRASARKGLDLYIKRNPPERGAA